MIKYFKNLGGFAQLSLNNEQLKSSIHMTHYKWQKYGLALKKTTSYEAAVASTYEVSSDIKDKILSTIPDKLFELETPKVWFLEVEGLNNDVSMIPPHIDSFRVCTINYYLKANGETTKYYNYKPNGSMDEVSSFCAKTGDCWILDTTIPHSVELIPGKTRSVLGVSFLNTPFETVSGYFS